METSGESVQVPQASGAYGVGGLYNKQAGRGGQGVHARGLGWSEGEELHEASSG